MNTAVILIPLCAMLMALIESRYTLIGKKWYEQIRKPEWTPSGNSMATMWTGLFILYALSAIISLQETEGIDRYFIAGLYIANAILTILWSYILFKEHQIGIAVFEVIALWFSITALVIAVASSSYVAMLLLVPYLCWVTFTAYMTHKIWKLNTKWKWSRL